ncbi:MAG TPA: molybdopterin-synthase adenylyltransferase MoeB [Gammaproteobacteria bacterium]
MDDETLNRYTRQMVLPDFGYEGQEALRDAHVMIVGLGGLGSPAAIYLAAAGIGELTLADFDRVALSNLHRQILYDDHDLGHKKTAAAAGRLQEINRTLLIHSLDKKITVDHIVTAIDGVDIVLDCTDNFATRYAVNQACVDKGKPLISGAAIRLEGQIAVFNNTPRSPCYACLYPDATDVGERCSDVGVIGPLVGIIGSMQALEAIKLITGIGEPLDSRLLLLDAATLQWRNLKLNKDPGCAVCGDLKNLTTEGTENTEKK